MKLIKKSLVFTLTTLLFLSMFIPMSGAEQAEKPGWEVGQKWSMGAEQSMDTKLSSSSTMDGFMGMGGTVESYNLDIEGEMGFYQIYEITDADEDQYTMDITGGGGIHIEGSFSVTGQFPKEGNYTIDGEGYDSWQDDIPTEKMTMKGSGNFHLTLSIDGTAHFTKDTNALKDIDLEVSMKMKGKFEGKNLPLGSDTSVSYSTTYENGSYKPVVEGYAVYGYEDLDMDINGDISASILASFNPALDIFNFPIYSGKTWDIDSNVTMSGNYEGSIDANGLPDEFKELMDAEDVSFPMTLEDMDTDSEYMKDGEIQEHTEEISYKGECTGTEELELGDQTMTVYLLSYSEDSNEYEYPYEYDYDFGGSYGADMVLKYSPEEEFFVSNGAPEGFDDEMGMAGSFIQADSMQMEPVSVEEAEESMKSLQSMPADKESSGSMDLFAPPMIYLVIGLIAAVVLVVLFVGMRARGKSDHVYPPGESYTEQGDRGTPPPPQQSYAQQPYGGSEVQEPISRPEHDDGMLHPEDREF
ncbi:MAG: hypothetical protein R6U61_00815 [Thermoplasmata archaeon]